MSIASLPITGQAARCALTALAAGIRPQSTGCLSARVLPRTAHCRSLHRCSWAPCCHPPRAGCTHVTSSCLQNTCTRVYRTSLALHPMSLPLLARKRVVTINKACTGHRRKEGRAQRGSAPALRGGAADAATPNGEVRAKPGGQRGPGRRAPGAVLMVGSGHRPRRAAAWHERAVLLGGTTRGRAGCNIK